MSVTVVKEKEEKGMRVVTMETGPNDELPLLSQVVKGCCCSPMCCSVRTGLTQSTVYAALGAVQIMLGLFNIPQGPGRTPKDPYDLNLTGAAYWMGGLYILAGVTSVLAGRFPSVCTMAVCVWMNLHGLVCAIAGLAYYSVDLTHFIRCDLYDYVGYVDDDHRCRRHLQAVFVAQDVSMIIAAALQLCICISFIVLSIKAIMAIKRKLKEERDTGDGEAQQPELKEVLLTSPSAEINSSKSSDV